MCHSNTLHYNGLNFSRAGSESASWFTYGSKMNGNQRLSGRRKTHQKQYMSYGSLKCFSTVQNSVFLLSEENQWASINRAAQSTWHHLQFSFPCRVRGWHQTRLWLWHCEARQWIRCKHTTALFQNPRCPLMWGTVSDTDSIYSTEKIFWGTQGKINTNVNASRC